MLKNNPKSHSKRGHLNPMWRGDDVGYGQLHDWVIRRMPKPKVCDMCGKEPPRDLANKGVYNRELCNWEWLCRRCHMKSDGRLDAFLSHQKKFPKGNKYYKLAKHYSGDEHPTSKLTWDKVREMRKLYKTGEYTLKQLGDKYGVIFQNVSLVVNNKTWKEKEVDQ